MPNGGLRSWALEHKLTLIFGVVSALLAIVGMFVSLATTHGGSGGSSAKIVNNNGQVNIGGIVNNYSAADPMPSGPSLKNNSCPADKWPQYGPDDTLAVDLAVRRYSDGACWNTQTIEGKTPVVVEFEIRYVNTSADTQQSVIMRVNLAPGLQLVPGSTYLGNSIYPTGTQIDDDDVDKGGLIVGAYAPHAAAYVVFRAQTPAIGDLKCGPNVLRTVGVVQPKGKDEYYNTADIDLTRDCPSPSTSAS